MTLQPGEDREFKNMFSEFLKQNLPKENAAEEAQTKETNERLKGLRKAQKYAVKLGGGTNHNMDFHVLR